jgi:GNAT superfamily N-acetyltransferase
MRDWQVSLDPSRVQMDVVFPWLHGSYWSPGVRRDVVERAFANSLVAGAYDRAGRQVGVARLVSDRATFAWLCDVFVDESVRGQGIGRAMVSALVDHPELATVRRWVLATLDAHDVYRPFGFRTVDATRWMEMLPDPARWT